MYVVATQVGCLASRNLVHNVTNNPKPTPLSYSTYYITQNSTPELDGGLSLAVFSLFFLFSCLFVGFPCFSDYIKNITSVLHEFSFIFLLAIITNMALYTNQSPNMATYIDSMKKLILGINISFIIQKF